jgi:hypothetical protein
MGYITFCAHIMYRTCVAQPLHPVHVFLRVRTSCLICYAVSLQSVDLRLHAFCHC